MGVHDAPAWLLTAFVRSTQEAGATAPVEEVRRRGEELLARWSDPERTFHNLRHLADVLMRVDELAEETHEPDLVRLAAWYHGAVFDAGWKRDAQRRGGEDEHASALLAQQELLALGVPEKRAQRVHDLVATLWRHAPDPADVDCSVLCDADLAMLAAEPQRYKTYVQALRAEYAHVPTEDFLRARLRIVHKLLERPRLFASPLGAGWEEPARQNLAAEEQRLRKELDALLAQPAQA
ncbi:HD domain-containing protein [Cellulomonas marina]|uniref:Predicted metal-dependent phosphohydrolase, HD superfamily n=1 Tax=Cellulomonas marina TaxID=988821 RepID=A0A1I0WL91_9CELL|nr:hypothetical protein [Cellulomonas marina]GIG27694.1 hypothetical protein Cma02nite_02940 [Cellulomonas marina]SFA88783.1 Predicted metal-dependent phosphohydrolase, HD superfamily [Cellulomonas marina]